jgi:hypothetical protein
MPRLHMLLLLVMTPGVVLAESASTSSGPICTIMNPLLSTALGCKCTDADSGVGGTSACPLTIPAVPLLPGVAKVCTVGVCSPEVIALAVPAMTFSIGATVLPCGTPASASVHGSIVIDLPAGTPTAALELAINGVSGLSVSVASSKLTIAIEKSVKAGEGKTMINIPLATGVVAQIGLTVYARSTPPHSPRPSPPPSPPPPSPPPPSRHLLTIARTSPPSHRTGTVASLTVAETLDICATAGGKSYCGADIATIPGVGSTAAKALGNPPWELGKITAGFKDACKEAAASAPVSALKYKVATSFTMSGSISDYGSSEPMYSGPHDPVVKMKIRNVLAAASPLTHSEFDFDITLTAGSVLVTAEIKASNKAAANKLSTALTNGILASSTKLESALAAGGISTTISAITPPTVVEYGNELDAITIVIIVGASAIGVALLCIFSCFLFSRRSKKAAQAAKAKEAVTQTV